MVLLVIIIQENIIGVGNNYKQCVNLEALVV